MKTIYAKRKYLTAACFILAFMVILGLSKSPAWADTDLPASTDTASLPAENREANPADRQETSDDASADREAKEPSVPPTLWVVGDSTAAAFHDTSYYYPRYGWGTQLDRYFEGVVIENLAVSGTSSQSFLETSQYERLLQEIKPGDYLIIGFGHNDEKAESLRYTNPSTSISTPGSIQHYLFTDYIQPAREAGATPILCTPIVRRDLGNNYTGASGHIIDSQTTVEGTFPGGDYAKAIRNAGVAKSVPVLDLTKRTKDIYERLGAQGVKDRHAWLSSREASIDNTHTNLYGAAWNAWLIADELLKTDCPLKNYLTENPEPPALPC